MYTSRAELSQSAVVLNMMVLAPQIWIRKSGEWVQGEVASGTMLSSYLLIMLVQPHFY